MEFIHIIILIIMAIFLLEILKHFLVKKTSKTIILIFIILVFFLLFSYNFKDVDFLKENQFIQTGAVIADKLVTTFNNNVDTEVLLNSTVKSNKLFKS